MIKNLLVLPDGTEVFSGSEGAAIMALELTRSVNEQEELTLGAACAAMAEITLMGLEPGRIAAGDTLTLYTVDNGGVRHKTGLFLAEKPRRTGSYTLAVTAYDRLTLLDKDLTAWLGALEGWPYTLQDLAQGVCDACGVTLRQGALLNGGTLVEKFTAEGVTGRQLMGWIGEAAGCFCRANAEGELEFAWYAPAAMELGPTPVYAAQAHYEDGGLVIRAEDAVVTDGVSVTSAYLQLADDGAGNVTLLLSDALTRQFCFQGGMTLAEHIVSPIQKVQIRRTEEDVGTVYPPDAGEGNAYIITGNPLLTAGRADALQSVAQALYQRLSQVSYTPCTVKLPADPEIVPGSVLKLTDSEGRTVTVYVMTAVRSGQVCTLECTGSARRDSSTAVNNQSLRTLSGKVLNLRTDVDGLKAENRNAVGNFAQIALEVSNIRSQVTEQKVKAEDVDTRLTKMEQTAEAVQLSVQSIQDNGVKKVSTEFGLTVDASAVTIQRSGSEMTNSLDEKGMYVKRNAGAANEAVMLQADANGVIATDVSVRNYLSVGRHARLEDYGQGRTACFWMEEET